jgi:DnaJ-domain-containing protein 1
VFSEYYTYESLFAPLDPEPAADGPVIDAEAFASLGLEPDAPWQDVVTTYRRLAKEHHPDRLAGASPEELDQANERLRDVNFAYARLRALFREGDLGDTAAG